SWCVVRSPPAGLQPRPSRPSRSLRRYPRRPRVAVIRFLSLAIATALGVGYVPIAPGTFGSAVGLLLWAILPASAMVRWVTIVLMLIVVSLAGNVAETYFKR